MFFKRLPLSIVLFFNILGSGFFYAQTNFIPNLCPLGRPEHRDFVCQCAPLRVLKDTVKPVQKVALPSFEKEMYCPWGRHNFICQCGPKPADWPLLQDTKKKKSSRKNKRRSEQE